jgi:hypothetical protein
MIIAQVRFKLLLPVLPTSWERFRFFSDALDARLVYARLVDARGLVFESSWTSGVLDLDSDNCRNSTLATVFCKEPVGWINFSPILAHFSHIL